MEVDECDVKVCGLCVDMDWDEAIYCPQCHGSGKIENHLIDLVDKQED